MSKKSRRRKKRAQSRRATQSRPESAPASSPSAPAETDFSEYRYVITDLQRVAALAGIILALLIALSFVLR